MSRCIMPMMLFISTMAVLGCADKQPAAPTIVKQTVESTTVAEPEVEPAVEVAQPAEPPATKTPDEVTPAFERILILARGGPLLVDVSITFDGQAYDAGLEALIDRVVRAGDTNEDGKSTWDEWRENQEFLQGDLANLNPIQERRVRDWVKRYDLDEDGKIQRTEAAAWLGRDGGRSATALRLRSSRSYAALGSTNSRLWQIFDANNDGRLANDELDGVTKRLFLLDTNDDRIVDSTELATLREQLSAQSQQRESYSRTTRRDAAVRLQDRSDASELDYLLSDLYAPRQQLSPSSFSARRRLFDELDLDQDQTLDAQELEAMIEVRPHLQLALDFSAAASNAANVKLTVLDQAPEIEEVIQNSDARMIAIAGDTRFAVSAHDLSSTQGEQDSVQSNQIALMVHDRGDELFEALDADADGKLGEREIFTAADRIRGNDANRDGKLDSDELPYSMTVAFLRAESANQQSFYAPSVATMARPKSADLVWFRDADLNGDGDVSRSEFLGSFSQFAKLDDNRDGFISSAEASLSETK